MRAESIITVFNDAESITLPAHLTAKDPRIAALSEPNRAAYLDMSAKMDARERA